MLIRPRLLIGVISALFLCGCSILTDFDNDLKVDGDGGSSNNANTNTNNNNAIVHPDCNNNQVDGDEQCDDGNDVQWDGCHQCNIVEFQVNDDTTGDQLRPAVAAQPGFGFLVTWIGAGGSAPDLFAQLYAEDGAVLISPFRVNTATQIEQAQPAVAPCGGGTDCFVVVWLHDDSNASLAGIYGQRITLASREGPEFRVSGVPGNPVEDPTVADRGPLGFVVAWTAFGRDAVESASIFGRMFGPDATPDSTDFRIHEDEVGDQLEPSVGSDPFGNFWVAWSGTGQNGRDIFARRFWNDGAPDDLEFGVATHTVNDQMAPSVARGLSNGVTVLWDSGHINPTTSTAFGQRYSEDKSLLGAEFDLYEGQHTGSGGARAVVHGDQSFSVFWVAADENNAGIFGRRFNFMGAPEGEGPTRINVATLGDQQSVSAASYGTTSVVCWQASDGQDGDGQGIFCTRLDANLNPIPIGSNAPP
jgi:cysteine-rich repeat protein